jgi:hypothetical protein
MAYTCPVSRKKCSPFASPNWKGHTRRHAFRAELRSAVRSTASTATVQHAPVIVPHRPTDCPGVSTRESLKTCPRRDCISLEACRSFVQECETSEDCACDSCCLIKDLDVIASNIPSASLPGQYVEICQPRGDRPRTTYCYNNMCVAAVPDWFQTSKLSL